MDMVSLVADMHHLHPVVGRPCVARSPSDAPKPQRRPVVHVEAAIELLAACWTDPVAGSSGVAEAFAAAAAVDIALGLAERSMSVERGS